MPNIQTSSSINESIQLGVRFIELIIIALQNCAKINIL